MRRISALAFGCGDLRCAERRGHNRGIGNAPDRLDGALPASVEGRGPSRNGVNRLDPLVVALLLLAALLHAAWNAVVRATGDRLLALATVMATGSVAGLAILPLLPVPERASWPYLALSVALHGGYNGFLVLAYRSGDLSQVYPIARGIAPAGVALLSAGLASEALAPRQWAALCAISLGIASLAFTRPEAQAPHGRPVAAALVTGLFISAYSFVDGVGARAAGTPISYIAWQFFLAGLPITVVALLRRRGQVRTFLRAQGAQGVLAGAVAAIAYGIAIWAMSRSPLAYVASLRETSVIFAALIGSRLLGEPFGGRRLSASLVVAGAIVALASG